MTISYETEPIVLTEGEYLYLTEALEPLTGEQVQDGAVARFVVRSRQEVLRQVVQCVLEGELTDEERAVAKLLFMEGESITGAARRCALTRGRVYTLAQSAGKKLEMYLKYPFLLDFSLAHPDKPIAELVKQYGGAVCSRIS